MRSLRVLIPVVTLLAGGTVLAWYVHTAPERAARRHLEAMERWPAVVECSFQADPKEVSEIFHACFRKGDPAAD
jgi:hypothetical protein